MLAGVLMVALHAVLSIRYKVNQIISGAVIIILALGLTSYLQRAFLNEHPELNNRDRPSPRCPSPACGGFRSSGRFSSTRARLSTSLFLLVIVIQIVLFNTRWGLRLRAVGEHPKAADTLGINVFRMRYMAVLISGAIAGLAGAYFSVGSVGRFDEGMTAGKGFMGMAAMIFGNWNPGGALFGSLIFGFFDSLQESSRCSRWPFRWTCSGWRRTSPR